MRERRRIDDFILASIIPFHASRPYNAGMDIKASTSEDHGIELLTSSDRNVLSVGISTGGVAEIRMATSDPERHIIATTIDGKGLSFAEKYIAEQNLDTQIETKVEDVSEPLDYPEDSFDYIYARLVLHYLPEAKLQSTLLELRRVLKPGGKLYIVVRSTKCPDATAEGAQYDPETHLTTHTAIDEKTGGTYSYSRYFHTEESIRDYVTAAGFTVSYVKSYDEQLYVDFMRTKLSDNTDNVIELLAVK
jgi:ubiquinone/menaquinone biosynthesis C-methylase UbiE